MRRLLTPRWLAHHGLAATLAAAFLALGWWQIDRAASGNALSWAYAIQWPIFAGFVVFVWWREVQRALRPGVPPPRRSTRRRGDEAAAEGDGGAAAEEHDAASDRRRATATDTGFRSPVVTARRGTGYAGHAHPDDRVDGGPERSDGELAAYNRYLAWLNANPRARPGDYPG